MKQTLETLAAMSDDELNQIATEAMGKCWHQKDKIGATGFLCTKCGASFVIAPQRPSYTTSIADAWKLVLFAESKGFYAVMKTPFEVGEPYSCGFTPKGVTGWNGRPDYFAQSNTMPKAITLAFCLAMEDVII